MATEKNQEEAHLSVEQDVAAHVAAQKKQYHQPSTQENTFTKALGPR